MNKFLGVLVLTGASLLVVSGTTGTLAQGKKGAAKSAAKGTIELVESTDGKYRFSIRNSEGKYLGGSGPKGYATEKDAKAAVEEMKAVLLNATYVSKKSDAFKEKDDTKAKDKDK